MSKQSDEPVQIFYDSLQLSLAVGPKRIYYQTMPGGLNSKISIKSGTYLIKPQEISANSWTFSSALNHFSLNLGGGRQETLCFKLYSSDGTLTSSENFFVFGLQAHSFGYMCSIPSFNPFSKFLADLSLAAHKSHETLIPLTINTDKVNLLNLDALKGYVPDNVIEDIRKYANKYGIISNLRLAYFLGQMKVESNFKGKSEGLRYTTEKRLWNVFKNNKCPTSQGEKNPPACFSTQKDVKPYLRNPEKLGNYIYAFKIGNDSIESGDGYKFRGRGGIQITGKENYQDFADSIDPKIMDQPNLINTEYTVASAGYFFKKHKLWLIVDKGTRESNLSTSVTEITVIINRRKLELTKRIEETKNFCEILGIKLTL